MKTILQKESSVLREIAKEVPIKDISSSKIRKIIHEMKEAMDSQDDGVAIAAPQIGYSLRIFIVSKKVESIVRPSHGEIVDARLHNEKIPTEKLVFINPVIKKISKEKRELEEGCLSVRYLYGHVSRGKKATVIAYDENGKKFERGGTGLLAQIFQHEVDHLNGVLFIDKAKYIEEVLPGETHSKIHKQK